MQRGPVLSRYTLDQIGKGLLAHYDETVWKPLPVSMHEQLRRMDAREQELAAGRT